jgi:hypothetical protein
MKKPLLLLSVIVLATALGPFNIYVDYPECSVSGQPTQAKPSGADEDAANRPESANA